MVGTTKLPGRFTPMFIYVTTRYSGQMLLSASADTFALSWSTQLGKRDPHWMRPFVTIDRPETQPLIKCKQ